MQKDAKTFLKHTKDSPDDRNTEENKERCQEQPRTTRNTPDDKERPPECPRTTRNDKEQGTVGFSKKTLEKLGRWRRNLTTIITINLCKMKEKESPEHKNKIVDEGESMKKKNTRYRNRKTTIYLSSSAGGQGLMPGSMPGGAGR